METPYKDKSRLIITRMRKRKAYDLNPTPLHISANGARQFPSSLFLMLLELEIVWLLLLGRCVASLQEEVDFTYNGFRGVELSLDGLSQITENGLLMLANETNQQVGHAFYPNSFHLGTTSTGTVLSFSTTFVFAFWGVKFFGPAIGFVIASTKEFPGAFPGNYMGLFNRTNIGSSSNHVIAIEMDCLYNAEFNDINGNHIGININNLKSVQSAPASYFSDKENRYVNLSLTSGQPLQLWVEYNGAGKQLNVTLAPLNVPKPTVPLLSYEIDISKILLDPVYVGFSTATYTLPTSHYILGWSFKLNGQAGELTLSQLPKLPTHKEHKTRSTFFGALFSVIGATVALLSVLIIQFMVKRKRKFAEVFEDWEVEYGSHRFSYKDLYKATKGFKDEEFLGAGAFGMVYRGVLPKCKTEVAVKRVSHNYGQGEREFIAEIISIGKLRHRNIVRLLGYCRRKEELFLVYDFMPNRSLDKFLFDRTTTETTTLSWCQRFRVIKSVAAALLYLHEEWKQVVVHRDIKSSNVLLDKELNGKLGDFGLARLYDHGTNPQTTHVVGTLGYLAPELCETGKAKPSVDVFAFGAFLLEVACGRRPIETEAPEECIMLVDWVFSCWSRGSILETVDPKLGLNYQVQEMEVVLKLGLLCSHPIPTVRPCMRQVVSYLEGVVPLPELICVYQSMGTDELTSFMPSEEGSHGSVLSRSSSVAESVLSSGR